jgi:hypothetical protein
VHQPSRAKRLFSIAGFGIILKFVQCRKILKGKSLLAALTDYAQRNTGVIQKVERAPADRADFVDDEAAARAS